MFENFSRIIIIIIIIIIISDSGKLILF